MTDRDFQITLESGEWAEEIVAQLLISKGWRIIHFWKGNEYDILASKDGRRIKVEVKLDQTPIRRTINIEYESSRKPSGISVTTADYYFNLQPQIDELLIMKVEDIKKTIKDKGTNIKATNAGSFRGLGMMYNLLKEEIPNKTIEIDWKKYETNKYPRPEKLKDL